MMSWPHFYQADPSLLDQVVGLNPDRTKHQFQLDILPVILTAIIRGSILIIVYFDRKWVL